MAWIYPKAFFLILPTLADVFVGGQPFQSFQSFGTRYKPSGKAEDALLSAGVFHSNSV